MKKTLTIFALALLCSCGFSGRTDDIRIGQDQYTVLDIMSDQPNGIVNNQDGTTVMKWAGVRHHGHTFGDFVVTLDKTGHVIGYSWENMQRTHSH